MTNERLGVSAADLDDLELPRLEAFLIERAPALFAALGRDELGVRAGLLSRIAPRVVPSVAGLYLFGKLPQLYFPEWGVTCIASPGSSLADPVATRLDVDGSIVALCEGCEAFVEGRTGSGNSGEGAEYDQVLVRESIVNALVHRDLRKPSRVALRMFADRMEVWSPGGPPEGMSDLEEVARDGGTSIPRNPLVAGAARRLGLGEQLGRGLVLLVQGGTADGRVEVRATPRDVLVTIPSRWHRPSQMS